jgi:hypothetical protein
MFNRLWRWFVRCFRSILIIGMMAGLYAVMVLYIDQCLWPNLYLNGEPVASALASGVQVRVMERAAFQARCVQTYWKMGFVALVLYIVYVSNGWLTMSHGAHVEFSKKLRKATLIGFFTLQVGACSELFVIPNAGGIWDTVKNTIILVGFVGYIIYFFKMIGAYRRAQATRKILGGLIPLANLVFTLLFAFLLNLYDAFASLISQIPGLFFTQNVGAAAIASGRYGLSIGADYLLPALFILLWVWLAMATKYVSPESANTVSDGLYAQLNNGKARNEEGGA